MPVGEAAAALPREGGAFAFLAGETAGDKPPLQHRRQNIAQRMMNHTVGKRRGGDDAALRIEDLEEPVAARLVGAREQPLPQAAAGSPPGAATSLPRRAGGSCRAGLSLRPGRGCPGGDGLQCARARSLSGIHRSPPGYVRRPCCWRQPSAIRPASSSLALMCNSCCWLIHPRSWARRHSAWACSRVRISVAEEFLLPLSVTGKGGLDHALERVQRQVVQPLPKSKPLALWNPRRPVQRPPDHLDHQRVERRHGSLASISAICSQSKKVATAARALLKV